MVFSKDNSKKLGKRSKNIKTRSYSKKRIIDYFLLPIIILTYPCYKFFQFLSWLYNLLFCETIKTAGSIGFGPAFRDYYSRKFSCAYLYWL